ncbi:hypothetical protein LK994_04765 [Ferruginibacter lapsinanis]|uniref:hypothetical protein n=1 Tax=Ferruginibacter lapsinanis TaxID=563172 RepID=UPI001E3E43B4|nr:hypothetical protein [Ferruginibacter lapsinanis]UEG50785.1 hypothetical protein LK994_04765 [Ferruginibacter lapsinanis]
MKKVIYLLASLLFSTGICIANNVQITNMSIVNGGPGAIQVKFDLTWDNSWRTNVGPANYDGVWVFFKYKNLAGDWVHMNLTGSNNVAPAGFDIFQNSGFTKVGAMIYREDTNLGTGSASALNVKLGVISSLPYDIDVKGFAIEMVYVPAPTSRPFFGDGNGITESVNALHYTDNTATTTSVVPMLCDVNGFDDAELDADGIYIYSNDTIQTTNPLGALDPFPTMKALWCMKYEINQASYRDFLNTLDSQQQASRVAIPITNPTGSSALSGGISRNYIEIATPGAINTPAVFGCDANGNNIYNEAGDGEWIACNFLAWVDVAAYLDWSGLAPMSELQYERICRGSSSAGGNAAALGEYAWGSDKIFASNYSLTNPATASEIASNASVTLGNAAYTSTASGGPLRSGIFATATSNRVISGATYYGVMEMSGNMPEYCISLGSQAGRSCRYVPNGNGTISALGNAQLSVGGAGFWPGMEGNLNLAATTTCSGTCEVTSSGGIRFRGGSIGDAVSALAISDRSAVFTPTARASNRGGRGVLYIR